MCAAETAEMSLCFGRVLRDEHSSDGVVGFVGVEGVGCALDLGEGDSKR